MNKKLGLAVAGAVMAFASSAQAGITIPAGDWTLDVGGVVNAYYTSTRQSGDFEGGSGAVLGGSNASNDNTESNITTGLLPNYLAVSGKTRQNDLDVAFTISINPGASTTRAGNQGSNQENRQAFLTFGDASWGSVKVGKDLGIFASDAILNDMTLLGVGSGAGILAGNTTTLGRIGTGFMYADWKAQLAYTTPNWNGFQATAGVTQAWNATNAGEFNDTPSNTFKSARSSSRGGAAPAFEAKASYSWTGDVAGKVWVSGITQKVSGMYYNSDASKFTGTHLGADNASAWDIGANVNVAGFGLTGYYGKGDGLGTTLQLRDGFDQTGKSRDSKDYYVQATYVLPTTTKLGVSWGKSKLDGNSIDTFDEYSNKMWTVGAYHPITKNLNLVAEYSDVKTKINYTSASTDEGTSKTTSIGAILFF